MSFKGYDYTELFPVLGLSSTECDGLETEVDEFRGCLKRVLAKPVKYADVIKDIREYTAAMIDADPGYWGPIWRGLTECEDDFTFMQAFYALAEHAWT